MGDLLPARGFGASTTGLDRLPAARTPPHGPSGLNLGGPYGASRLDAFSGRVSQTRPGNRTHPYPPTCRSEHRYNRRRSLDPLRVNGRPRVYSVRRRWGRPGARRTSGGGRSAVDPRGQVRGRASARRTDAMFERFTDRARRVVVLAQEEATTAQPQLHRDRAHPARADPRGRGRRRQGARVDEHLARGGSRTGRGDHRPGQAAPIGPHPVHASRQEGPRAVVARGAAARSQLHRHRAHPARPDPRGRGRRRPGARRSSAPTSTACASTSSSCCRATPAARSEQARPAAASRGQPGGLARARPVRPKPHAARARSKLDPVIGREKEIERVIQILRRRTKNNPVLLGEAGVGKTAIVEGLAQGSSRATCPRRSRASSSSCSTWRDGRRHEVPRPVRGAHQGGHERDPPRGDIILFIDELHTLVGAGAAEGAIDAASS